MDLIQIQNQETRDQQQATLLRTPETIANEINSLNVELGSLSNDLISTNKDLAQLKFQPENQAQRTELIRERKQLREQVVSKENVISSLINERTTLLKIETEGKFYFYLHFVGIILVHITYEFKQLNF
jgi:hypothetical protein